MLKSKLTSVIAPGGTGKTLLMLIHAVSLALGLDLLNVGSVLQKKVLIISNEDDVKDMKLRLRAVMKQFDFSPTDIAAISCNLYIDAFDENKDKGGFRAPIKLATLDKKTGEVLPTKHADRLIDYCIKSQTEVVFIDPLVGFHDIPENDNTLMEKVMAILRTIAGKANVAIYINHHARKGSSADTPDDNSRGATAVNAAVRFNFNLAKMTEKEAAGYLMDAADHEFYVRWDSGKKNFTAPSKTTRWFKLNSVVLRGINPETGAMEDQDFGVPLPVLLSPTQPIANDWSVSNILQKVIHEEIESPLVLSGTCLEQLGGLLSGTKKPIARNTIENRLDVWPDVGAPKRTVEVLGHKYLCWKEKNKLKKNRIEYHFEAIKDLGK